MSPRSKVVVLPKVKAMPGKNKTPKPKAAAPTPPTPKPERASLTPETLRRVRPPRPEPEEPATPASVSAGPIDKVIELAFNPSREKIREVTIIDRLQGRLFPLMDVMNTLYHHCVEVATYRQSEEAYKAMYKKDKPMQLDIMDDLMYRTAQWQKSVGGTNLGKATDIALAETETRAGEEGESPVGSDAFRD